MSTQQSISLGSESAAPELNTRPLLDHLIALVDSVEAAGQHFTSLGFTVVAGGRHADGVTENCLVVLPDGVYFELIAFVSPSPNRSSHWWGAKREGGWIDWALTPPASTSASQAVRQAEDLAKRESGAERWNEPRAGGRETPEGKRLEWEVAFPKESCGPRGRLPFICADKTPREWRVPPPTSPHANGARAISSLTVLAQPTRLSPYAAGLTSVLDPLPPGPSSQSDPGNYARSREFALRTPHGPDLVLVTVREAETDEEQAHVRQRGEGLYSVTLKADRSSTDSKYGKLVLSAS